jgi:hypothetical protein
MKEAEPGSLSDLGGYCCGGGRATRIVPIDRSARIAPEQAKNPFLVSRHFSSNPRHHPFTDLSLVLNRKLAARTAVKLTSRQGNVGLTIAG